jgi:hypothetical protein
VAGCQPPADGFSGAEYEGTASCAPPICSDPQGDGGGGLEGRVCEVGSGNRDSPLFPQDLEDPYTVGAVVSDGYAERGSEIAHLGPRQGISGLSWQLNERWWPIPGIRASDDIGTHQFLKGHLC